MSERLQICHVASGDLWAGAEVQTHALLTHLRRDPGLDVRAVLFNEGRLAESLRALEVPVTILDESALGARKIQRRLADEFRSTPVDVLHTHKYKENVLATAVARDCGVRGVVRTLHGLPEPFSGVRALKMRFYQWLDARANRNRVDRLIAVSEQIRRELVHHPAGKVVCVHNGIDHEAVQAHRGSGRRDPGVFVIGTVGRLTPVKGYEFLMRALPGLAADRPVRWILAGDGPLTEPLRELAGTLGVSERVTFAGHRDDVLPQIDAMDLVVFPSLHEGIPMALLEALALEKPVVASDVGGIPEVIRDGESGLLVPPGDVERLAAACSSVIADPALAVRLGKAGSATVAREFSAAGNAARIAEIYRELATARR